MSFILLVYCKNSLCKNEIFADLADCLMNEDIPLKQKRLSVYLLLVLVANNSKIKFYKDRISLSYRTGSHIYLHVYQSLYSIWSGLFGSSLNLFHITRAKYSMNLFFFSSESMIMFAAFVWLCFIVELGQTLAQNSGCLDVLLNLFRYFSLLKSLLTKDNF